MTRCHPIQCKHFFSRCSLSYSVFPRVKFFLFFFQIRCSKRSKRCFHWVILGTLWNTCYTSQADKLRRALLFWFGWGYPWKNTIGEFAYRFSTRSRMSDSLHTVVLAPSLMAFGQRPDFTPSHQLDLDTGIIGSIGGSDLGSPMICFSLKRRGISVCVMLVPYLDAKR